MIRVFSIFLLIVLCQEAMAKTIFCKGKSCNDPDNSSPQLDVLVSQVRAETGLISLLQTYHPSGSGTPTSGDFARLLHPSADCYIEYPNFWARITKKSIGICRLENGFYLIGDSYGKKRLSSETTPLTFHGVASSYDLTGKYLATSKYFKGEARDIVSEDKAVPQAVFEEFQKKLRATCWYGDCKNGFGIKLVNRVSHKFRIGDWENGNRYTTYDSRGNLKKRYITRSALDDVIDELEGIYSKPTVSKKGWCFSGNCEESYGVLLSRNGDLYKGFFKNAKRHGAGNLTRQDSSSYTGLWSLGKQNGLGEELDVSGTRRKGNYSSGKKQGTFTVTYRNGSYQQIAYEYDKVIGTGTLTFPQK